MLQSCNIVYLIVYLLIHSHCTCSTQVHQGSCLSNLTICCACNSKKPKTDCQIKWQWKQAASAFKHTCAQREGVVPHVAEEAVDAVQTELPAVAVAAGALAVSATSPVAVTHSISVTGSVGASHTIFDGDDQADGTSTSDNSHFVTGFWQHFLESTLPLQSGPNVPFGQHTLMVSTQNHLCRSGYFVFLQCNDKQIRTVENSVIKLSETTPQQA